MKVYLAARYSRREELCGYREQLGHEVTSRWLNGEHQALDEELVTRPSLAMRFALDDLEDIEASRMLVAFTESPRTGATRGVRHVEFGMALQLLPIRTVVVGPIENVFHVLADARYETVADWIEEMSTGIPGQCRVCGCSEEYACVATTGLPCGWADETATLCTACDAVERSAAVAS